MAWQKKYLAEDEKSDDAKKATNRAVWYLSGRDYGMEELYQKLCRFFTQPAAAAAMANMAELGYLDDARFARNKARSLLLSHKSRRDIAQRLAQKGLDRDLINTVLDELYQAEEMQPYGIGAVQEPVNVELESAVVLIQRRYTRKLEAGRQDLVIAALTRKGFPYGIIRDALAQLACAEG